jgi:hypothetical protein
MLLSRRPFSGAYGRHQQNLIPGGWYKGQAIGQKRDGHRASRPRLLLRWLIAWGFVALPWLALLLPASPLRVGLLSATALVVLANVAAFIFRSNPRLHETLSGTRLVCR